MLVTADAPVEEQPSSTWKTMVPWCHKKLLQLHELSLESGSTVTELIQNPQELL